MGTDIAALLAEGEWLKRLARSLCGDAAEADDVVQEVYVAALHSPPDPDRPRRPWLRRVAHNVLRMRRRAGARRAANEAVTEQLVEPVAPPDDVVARARLERRLTELVLELDEPYRTTVLLRYREGLTAEAIAEREGIPAGTVRRRLKTALDRLRGELDDHDRDWRAAFVSLVARPNHSLWRLVMAKKLAVVIAMIVLALLVVGGVVWRARGSHRDGDDLAYGGHGGGSARSAAASMLAYAQPNVAMRVLDGIVTYEGAPVPGAAVRLADATTHAVLADATSDAGGRFTFGEREPTAYVVSATSGDKLAAEAVDARGTHTHVELQLARCSTLEGTVTEGSGAPISHARVVSLDAPTPVAETDAQGHYTLCARLGSSQFEYTAGGYSGVLVRFDVQGHRTFDAVLVPEATIAGTVVAANGTPVPDAWVTVDPFDKGGMRRAIVRARTDAAGAFRAAGVAPGRMQVSAVAAGGLLSRRIEVVTGPGKVVEGIVVRVERGARLHGIVKAGDTPVAGAGIGVRAGGFPVGNHTDQNGATLAVTQADGSFTIDRVPYGDLGFYVDGHTVVAPRSVHVAAPDTEVVIAVELLATLRGRVVRHGAPVGGAVVACDQGPAQYSRTDGSFACTGQTPGQHHVWAYDVDGHWGEASGSAQLGESASIDVELANDSRVCGRVVDAAGAPLSNIEVRLVDPTTGDQGGDTSSATGAFCIEYLTATAHQLAAYARGQQLEVASPKGAVAVGPGRLDITVVTQAPGLSISGTVVDAKGAPVADAIVRALPSHVVNITDDAAVTVTDPAGHFELGRLVTGAFTVIAGGDGGERIVDPVAAGTHDLTITLEPGGAIDGKLVGFASPPVITGVVPSELHQPIDAEVDGDHFRATGLPPGTYVLMAIASNHEGDTQKVAVRSGETAHVTMTSRGSATVVAHVMDWKQHAPISGARCATATRQGGDIGVVYNSPDDSVITDARGEARMDTSAGELVIMCRAPQFARAVKSTTAPAERTTAVDVFVVHDGQSNGSIDAQFEFLGKHVVALTKGGQADRAGLQVGDEVVAVDGASVVELDTDSMSALITQRAGGSVVALGILRGGQAKSISVIVRAIDR